MKKLLLDVDALVVESFDALPAPRRGTGTVRGHETIEPATADPFCVDFTGPDAGCALSDDDGTCYLSQCGQPGCGGSEDVLGCQP